jgi:hypothetical protein
LLLALGGSVRLPAGLILVNSNQSQLGREASSFTSQLIWTTDDIGFDANQCVTMTASVFTNTFLLGRTLRATNSRFKEARIRRGLNFQISLLTRSSLLNNTNNNHGDHCIFAFNTDPGRPPQVVGNQVVDGTLCSQLNAGIATPVSLFPVVVTIGGD